MFQVLPLKPLPKTKLTTSCVWINHQREDENTHEERHWDKARKKLLRLKPLIEKIGGGEQIIKDIDMLTSPVDGDISLKS